MAMPDPLTLPHPAVVAADARPASPGADLVALHRAIGAMAIADAQHDAAWRAQVDSLTSKAQALLARDRDNLLDLLCQDAQRSLGAYSARHALFCATVCVLCAEQLSWAADEVTLLVRCALTMNLSMSALQDELMFRERTPTMDQRRCVDEHAKRSADLLREAGVEDHAWLEVVERHHETPAAGVSLGALSPPQRLAALLHRVDVFTAKVSARSTRAALPANVAARDACLGADGRPDDLGTAVIKALGIYPPGSYVKLVSGETGVVRRRGTKANEPLVLSLIDSHGRLLVPQIPRHTGQAAHAVKSVVRPIDSRAIADHLRSGALTG